MPLLRQACSSDVIFQPYFLLGGHLHVFRVVLIPFSIADLWAAGHLFFLSPSEEASGQLVAAQQWVGSRRLGCLKEL